jgi:3-phosphoshikimate 1-carboxyvinyltransferase
LVAGVLGIRPLPPGRRVDAVVRLPGSKSLTNRALLLAALAEGETVLDGALWSEDTEACAEALRRLGVPVAWDLGAARATVRGVGGGPPAAEAALDVRLSGTTARFVPFYAALGHGRYLVDGSPRMRARPMGEVVAALRAQGVRVEGGPSLPIVVYGAGALQGGAVEVAGDDTSQPLSGLLMVAPYARADLLVRPETRVRVAMPYVDLTIRLMASFGVEVVRKPDGYLVPHGQRYRARRYAVEPDASAAAYFWALAAVTGGRVHTPGVGRGALQGDAAFLDVLEAMGCRVADAGGAVVEGPPGGRLRAVDADMNAMSDQALTLAVLGLFGDGPTRIRRVGHIRLQESDRIAAAASELRRLGARAEEEPDGLTVWPLDPGRAEPVCVATHGDHRVAMSFALVGLRRPGVCLAEPEVVRKTFPGYWEALRACLPPGTGPEGPGEASA